jgi:hypothetical protein
MGYSNNTGSKRTSPRSLWVVSRRQRGFIYMELVEGRTLEDVGDTLTQTDHALIHRQLHHIVTSLRSLRQASSNSFIGKFWYKFTRLLLKPLR